MINLNTYLLEKLSINKDTKVNSYDSLTDEELNYKFKAIISFTGGYTVKELIENYERTRNRDKDVSAAEFKILIPIDKLLAANGFKQRDKCKIIFSNGGSNELYFTKTEVNRNGYCVVFDPSGFSDAPWNFLVTKAGSKVGKTLRPLEFVEPKEFEEDIHKYCDDPAAKRTFYDDIEEAWDYIVKKYGRF